MLSYAVTLCVPLNQPRHLDVPKRMSLIRCSVKQQYRTLAAVLFLYQ